MRLGKERIHGVFFGFLFYFVPGDDQSNIFVEIRNVSVDFVVNNLLQEDFDVWGFGVSHNVMAEEIIVFSFFEGECESLPVLS